MLASLTYPLHGASFVASGPNSSHIDTFVGGQNGGVFGIFSPNAGAFNFGRGDAVVLESASEWLLNPLKRGSYVTEVSSDNGVSYANPKSPKGVGPS